MTKYALIIVFVFACLPALAAPGSGLSVQVASGNAGFLAPTNVPGIEVKGTSSALTATADVSRGESGLIVQRIDARLPVNSLATGMKIRDEHMRKYIFTGPSGDVPDIRFTSDEAACVAAPKGYSCQVSGQFLLRGIARPITIAIRVKEQGSDSFRAEGDGLIKLADYGIDPPSQFGVKPAGEIHFHLDFVAKGRTVEAGK